MKCKHGLVKSECSLCLGMKQEHTSDVPVTNRKIIYNNLGYALKHQSKVDQIETRDWK